MSTFLFASIPVVAHSTNPLPFATALIQRGHTVLWYAGSRFHPQIIAAGATPLPYREAFDFGDLQIEEAFPQLAKLTGVAGIKRAFADVFVGQAGARVVDLQRILSEHRVDAMLCDELMFGVNLTHELGGPVWATFGDGPLPYFEPDTPPFGPGLLPMRGPLGRLRNRTMGIIARRLVFSDAQKVYDRTRADLGLPVGRRPVLMESTSPYLHLHGCTPAFEYPRKQLPAHIHWVGALGKGSTAQGSTTKWQPPSWWSEVTSSDVPVVLVSQGSIRPDVSELLVPTLRALATEAVLVVAVTGAATVAELEIAYGGPLPANVRIADFIPYDAVLPHCRVFVTNGGYSGVTLALAHGIPLVQAGVTEEKAEIAARIAYSGVGIRLGTTRPTIDAVRQAVQRTLTESRFAAAALRVKVEMDEHHAGTEGADLLARLAATRQPVTVSR